MLSVLYNSAILFFTSLRSVTCSLEERAVGERKGQVINKYQGKKAIHNKYLKYLILVTVSNVFLDQILVQNI